MEGVRCGEDIEKRTGRIGRDEDACVLQLVPSPCLPEQKQDAKHRRHAPPEVELASVAPFERAAGEVPGIGVDIRRLLLARALVPRPGHERLVELIREHAQRVIGEPVPATTTPLYTDARLYGEAGVPIVLYGAGPRTILEANAKRADENLALEDLARATKVVASVLADLLDATAA